MYQTLIMHSNHPRRREITQQQTRDFQYSYNKRCGSAIGGHSNSMCKRSLQIRIWGRARRAFCEHRSTQRSFVDSHMNIHVNTKARALKFAPNKYIVVVLSELWNVVCFTHSSCCGLMGGDTFSGTATYLPVIKSVGLKQFRPWVENISNLNVPACGCVVVQMNWCSDLAAVGPVIVPSYNS